MKADEWCSSKQVSRLQLYEWTTTKPLHTARKHGFHGLRLSDGGYIRSNLPGREVDKLQPPEITLPLHIIPIRICSAFFIVTETGIYVAKAEDIMSGNAVFDKVEIPPSDTPSKQKS